MVEGRKRVGGDVLHNVSFIAGARGRVKGKGRGKGSPFWRVSGEVQYMREEVTGSWGQTGMREEGEGKRCDG